MLGKSKADGESSALGHHGSGLWEALTLPESPAPKSEKWKDWAVGHRSW